MLIVTSLNNVTYAAIAEVPRKQSINGEREITLSFLRGDINDKFIADIETGWTANFKGDKYHLFNEREDQHGNKEDRKSTRLNSSHIEESRMPSSA